MFSSSANTEWFTRERRRDDGPTYLIRCRAWEYVTPAFEVAPEPPFCLDFSHRYFALVMDYAVQDEPHNTVEMMVYIRGALKVRSHLARVDGAAGSAGNHDGVCLTLRSLGASRASWSGVHAS